jgi:hypothetical protein
MGGYSEDLERVKGIEPSYSAWEAAALPLSYTRLEPNRLPILSEALCVPPVADSRFTKAWKTRSLQGSVLSIEIRIPLQA